MGTVRKRYSAAFKAQVALEACKGQKTLSQLASEFGVHPVQITQWKKQALTGLPALFEGAAGQQHQADEALLAQLYQEIGQLKVELDWLRKKGSSSPSGADLDRSLLRADQSDAAVRVAGCTPQYLVLSAPGRTCGESGVDATLG